MFKAIPKEIRDQILSRIKNEGVSVDQTANDAGVSPKTVYSWLAKETAKTNCSIISFNRLRRDNQGLYQIIGKLTAELDKVKKGRLLR